MTVGLLVGIFVGGLCVLPEEKELTLICGLLTTTELLLKISLV